MTQVKPSGSGDSANRPISSDPSAALHKLTRWLEDYLAADCVGEARRAISAGRLYDAMVWLEEGYLRAAHELTDREMRAIQRRLTSGWWALRRDAA